MDGANPKQKEIIRYFHQHIRSENLGEVMVSGDEQDYLLDVQTMFIYPHIPPPEIANAKHRFNVIDGMDGLFLCLFYNFQPQPGELTQELCILTTDKLCWFSLAQDTTHVVPYDEVRSATFKEKYPYRGMEVVLNAGPRFVIPMQFHEAIINGLISFSTSVSTATGFSRVDINNANADILMTLPGITERRATMILEGRKRLHGFQTLEQFVELLGLGPEEMKLLTPKVVFHPMRSAELQGRRVDF